MSSTFVLQSTKSQERRWCSSFITQHCLTSRNRNTSVSTSHSMSASSKPLTLISSSVYASTRLKDVVEEPGFPPCLVFEKGEITLDEWQIKTNPTPFDRRHAIHQVKSTLLWFSKILYRFSWHLSTSTTKALCISI